MAELQLGGKVIATQSGANNPVLASNVVMDNVNVNNALASATFPAGHVINFVYVTSTTEYLSTSTTTYTDLTDFDLQITPTQPNSKIIIVLSGTTNSGSSNQVNIEYVNSINGTNSESYHLDRVNTNAIVELSMMTQIHRIYEHNQTNNFSALDITFKFRRYSSASPYGDTAFNYNGIFTNHAYAYAMEIS